MSSARLLELYPLWPTGGVSVRFMAKYLFDRTMADQTNRSNFPSITHGTVKRLMEYEQPKESGTNEKRQRDYIQMLCHLAASAVEWSYRDHWTLIENLIPNSIVVDENEADVNNVPRHTLAAASYIGKDELVTQLLSNENIDLHEIDFYASLYFTPLSLAAAAGHSSTVSLLLSHQNNVAPKRSAYETALERAAENGHTDIVINLLDHSIEEPAKKQEMVHRIFCLASYNNHPEVLLWALENGANINGQVKQALQEIPLSWAASRGHNDIVRLLLTKGANQHARRPHQPLSSAVNYGFASTVMLLIDTHIAGCGGGSYRDFFNEEKLCKDFVHYGFIVAAQHGHAHIVRLFVDLGFDLERYPKVGHSALMMAAQEGHESIARMLVEMWVNVNAEDGKESLWSSRNNMEGMIWWHS